MLGTSHLKCLGVCFVVQQTPAVPVLAAARCKRRPKGDVSCGDVPFLHRTGKQVGEKSWRQLNLYEKMELRDPAKEEIPEKKRNTSQKFSLGYLHMAVRQKTGMKTRAGSDPKEQQGHLGYGADSGPEIATRNRKVFIYIRRCCHPPNGLSCVRGDPCEKSAIPARSSASDKFIWPSDRRWA
ncbi:uncharacterized protein LOC124417616 [Gallus gallus]|uniref:uncharacterized protein LOC124417616 n=1 Tax=Gallus gallus TaxID=9031 RepID=UPI001EFF74A3|nr:uncharacterized protein LOC124417616 [Gallus gallus]